MGQLQWRLWLMGAATFLLGNASATRPPGGCHTDEFQCRLDALCIPMSWHCDGSTDCMDSSDEKNCEGVTRVCDPNLKFVCKDSAQCISKAWVCDGDNDCEDNSDEENCESLVCKPPSHTCANTSICLPPEKLCDGNDDCGDGSDEGQLCGTASFSHSLLYFRHALLLEGQPQFVEVTYLDSQPIQHYDSNTKRMRPLTLWINQTLDEDYWTWESNMNNFEEDFLEKLQELHPTVPQKHHNQSKDHTLQCIEGCKLTADGGEIEIHQDAFDGKKMRKENRFHRRRYYLDGNCIRWLNRYLDMKPQKKELPIVKVTHQEVSIDNLQTLTCQAYGFYPKEISASWRKDGEIFNQTNSSVHIAPNADETFNARLSILINPKERNLYRCHVEHVSSSEPLDFVLQKRGPSAEVTAHVLNVNDTLLNCSICNFYPEDIDATWMKDGENWDQETFRGDIIRNWDGTYCTWISIEINPMEEYRYCCYVEHEGLQEPLSVKVRIPTEENFQLLLIICCVVAVLVFFILSTIIGILWYKKRRRDYRPAAKSDPDSSLDNAEKCPLKEIEGVPPLNNTAGEESKGDIPNSQDTREKKQPPENHQISI